VRVEPQLQLQHIPLEKILEHFFLVEEKHAIHVQIFHEEIIFQDLLTSVPDISQMPGECGRMRANAGKCGKTRPTTGEKRPTTGEDATRAPEIAGLVERYGASWLGRALWG
jgi:hypothetical protein